ncbi:MAG TPA: DOMON-like domain-containing protein [Caulobacteraceae bacterium]|jgi:hypothetical protein|nr:DOMON-like domain-containing protein [Caulobacteraceae bacterium]
MRRALVPHPATPPGADIRIEAELARFDGGLTLAYVITGEIGRLLVAAPAPPERTDGLWRTTCFEAFLQGAGGGPYVELNLAPSGRWAAYRFSAPREGMTAAMLAAPPRIGIGRSTTHFELQAKVDLGDFPPPQAPWRVGLSAVIEETDGRKSYFALAHPSGKPDFHDSRGFVLEVAP